MESLNLRLVYAFRIAGRGRAVVSKVLGMLNLPPPPSQKKYIVCEKVLAEEIQSVAEASMKEAVEEAIKEDFSNEVKGTRDIAVALDGTWQKRGHRSLNGVMSASSVDNGKIVDLEAFSKFCRCPHKNDGQHLKTCTMNFEGNSGSMEVEGALKIFHRSMEKHNVAYTKYLGDGDSRAFLKVAESLPYGPKKLVQKLECVAHIQRRMQYGLAKTKSNDKSLGGKGKLTDARILKVQTFFGLAIRRNVGDLQKMKDAVWAIFYHLGSSDELPNHSLCEKDWCKFLQASEKGTYSFSFFLH